MDEDQRPKYELFRQICLSVSVCLLTILLGQLMRMFHAPDETVACLYILACVVISALTKGYWYGIISSILMSFAYSYFVVTPALSFSSSSPYIAVTTGLMIVISALTSSIMSRVKEGEMQAMRREEESQILYHLTKDLAGMTTVDEVIILTLQNISSVFHTDCRLLRFDADEKPMKTFVLLEDGKVKDREPTSLNRDFSEYKTRPSKGYYINASQYEWPLYTANHKVLASIAIPVQTASHMSTLDLRMVNTMAEAAGIVIDKLQLAKYEEQSRAEISQERYRTNLLRSISHDLRTPLAGISGTSEVLMSMLPEDSKEWQLAKSIKKETNWLYNMVQNVLSLTRLQNGTVDIKKQIMVVEDVVDSAAETMRYRLPEREIVTIYPLDVLIAPMDATLIKQVIINLVDNANKYSPPGSPIEIVVGEAPDEEKVSISVMDHGIGLSPGAQEKVFKMFYTTKAEMPNAQRGFGLGLPICDSIMKNHEGSITAYNRTDGEKGAVFEIFLPKYNLDEAPEPSVL